MATVKILARAAAPFTQGASAQTVHVLSQGIQAMAYASLGAIMVNSMAAAIGMEGFEASKPHVDKASTQESTVYRATAHGSGYTNEVLDTRKFRGEPKIIALKSWAKKIDNNIPKLAEIKVTRLNDITISGPGGYYRVVYWYELI